MRVFLLLFLLSGLHAKQDISSQINKTHKEIKSFDKKYSSLHKKMAETAKAIKRSEKEVAGQEQQIAKLSTQLKKSHLSYRAKQKELTTLRQKQQTLQATQSEVEKDLINAIARNISINSLVKERYVTTVDGIMTEEILKELNRNTQAKIANLDQTYSANAKNISSYQTRTEALKKSIDTIDQQKVALQRVTTKNKKVLKTMQNDKKYYKRSMKNLLAQKKALSSTLAKLNIIKQDEESKKARAYSKKRKNKKNATTKVTKRGSSYQRVKSRKYRGKKTIAPLSSYRLVKKFGPYTDPIYKIKIYNESVSLQPKQRNAKVRTVLNGKVILAKKTQLLDNVVIIKHANGLHTIYAHLDQIAPTIRKGKKIKKGATIGRVDHELTFEATQNNYHINPMTLIK